jgi:hypothetical protein
MISCSRHHPRPKDRLHRERDRLIAERVAHVNRVKGLCATQGIYEYEPLRRDRLKRLENLRTGDGRALAPRLKAEIVREIKRLEVVLEMIATVFVCQRIGKSDRNQSKGHRNKRSNSQQRPHGSIPSREQFIAWHNQSARHPVAGLTTRPSARMLPSRGAQDGRPQPLTVLVTNLRWADKPRRRHQSGQCACGRHKRAIAGTG